MTLLINLAIILTLAVVLVVAGGVFIAAKYVLTGTAAAGSRLQTVVPLMCLILFLATVFSVMTDYSMWPAFHQLGHAIAAS